MGKNRLLDYFTSVGRGAPEEPGVPHEWALGRPQLEQLKRSAEELIARNPLTALGTAVTMGVVLGWLIKRRL